MKIIKHDHRFRWSIIRDSYSALNIRFRSNLPKLPHKAQAIEWGDGLRVILTLHAGIPLIADIHYLPPASEREGFSLIGEGKITVSFP